MINIQHKDCVGCGVCSIICPEQCLTIEENKIGEYRPFVKLAESCVNCGICEKYCIAMNNVNSGNMTIKALYGYVDDENIRYLSSSGGVFYEIAKSVIEKNGVVVGAAFNNFGFVEHIVIDNISDLSLMRGSKYCESKFYTCLSKVKKNLVEGNKVLFSGVPCQIAALKRYIDKDYENLITCEIFCHGAPRVGVFKKYKYMLEKKYGCIKDFNFRSKINGWMNPSYKITTEKKIIIQKHKYNIYHLMFGHHHSLRESCLQCQFRKEKRQADLSLGDFWGIEKYYPYVKYENGVSAILVNTEKGNLLLKEQHLKLGNCKTEEIFDKNFLQIRNFSRPEGYNEFNENYQKWKDSKLFNYYRIQYLSEKIIRRVKRK